MVLNTASINGARSRGPAASIFGANAVKACLAPRPGWAALSSAAPTGRHKLFFVGAVAERNAYASDIRHIDSPIDRGIQWAASRRLAVPQVDDAGPLEH